MSNCCNKPKPQTTCCGKPAKRLDLILWGSLSVILIAVISNFILADAAHNSLKMFSHSITDLLTEMWWGLAIGIIFVVILGQIPQTFVMKILGDGKSLSGILRATFAGVLLDLCSHGILLVGMQLYKKGASTGQVMAFLIASPWNSFSLTLILWALIGFWWMLAFLILSFVIAVISGLIFNKLTAKGILPANPNTYELNGDFNFIVEAKTGLKNTKFNKKFFSNMLIEGISGSKMILKWIFFGVVLAALIKTFVPTDVFAQFFGATFVGLMLTIVAATVIEVCSEGSAPIASDLMNRAAAPGNSFTFLMAGVSTDYTEIMVLKETTGRWKIALFLPLVTLPQIILLGWLLNLFAG